MVLKAAVQALKNADVLKAQVTACCGENSNNTNNILLTDTSIWSAQQQLTSALHKVLVLDLDYALDQKVEQELWMLGFKNYIATLQSLIRDKKNPKRAEYQALLSWCLESASGFYLTLLQELCEAFQLDLPFRRRGLAYGGLMGRTPDPPSVPPQRASCLYICQYCLVHLGDIARYRNQRKQAESFYRHAILLSPASGQPYNQLALLQASRGDRLATVFYYVRSVALAHPFPPASSNLAKTLEIASNEESFSEVGTKLSASEFTNVFLKLHGLLHTGDDLQQAENIIKNLISAFTALAATDSFSSLKLIQMLAINLYVLKESTENFSEVELTDDEKKIRYLVSDLIAGCFNACLLPVYTLQSSNLLQYHSLPLIKLVLEWIRADPKILLNPVFVSRLQIWPSLCKLLNTIQSLIIDFDYKKYTEVPLPEDRDLQGFTPLEKVFTKLDFTLDDLKYDILSLNKLRAARLVQLGVYLTLHKVNDAVLIISKSSEDKNEFIFEPACSGQSPTFDLLKELEELKLKTESPECNKKDIASNADHKDILVLSETHFKDKNIQRPRTGILKPQGSLERAREEREQHALLLSAGISDSSLASTTLSDSISTYTENSARSQTEENGIVSIVAIKPNRKVRQNVAMQAILKKVEETSKQVKFQTEDLNVKEKKNKDQQKNQNNNKDLLDLSTKKGSAGILSLKNQSGYPHLANTEKEKSEPVIPPNNLPLNFRKQPTETIKEVNDSSKLTSTMINNSIGSSFPQQSNVNFSSLPFSGIVKNITASSVQKLNDYVPNAAFTNFGDHNVFQARENFPFSNNSTSTSPNYSNYQPIKTPSEYNSSQSQINLQNVTSQSFNNTVQSNQLRNLLPNTISDQFYNYNSNLSNNSINTSSSNYSPITLPPNSNTPSKQQFNYMPFQQSSNNSNQIYGNFGSSFSPQQDVDGKLKMIGNNSTVNSSIYDTPNVPNQNYSSFSHRNLDFLSNIKPQQGPWNPNPNDKIPMPPSGWWSNNLAKQENMSTRFSNNIPLPNQVSPTQNQFLPNNTIKENPVSWMTSEFSNQDSFIRGGTGISTAWNNTDSLGDLHKLLVTNLQSPGAPQVNQNVPLTNNGLTARQKMLKENRRIFSKKNGKNVLNDTFEIPSDSNTDNSQSQPLSPPGYSLFNSNWAPNLSNTSSMTPSPASVTNSEPSPALISQQSLFSGPGPSPLERLLEQQKQLRGQTPTTK